MSMTVSTPRIIEVRHLPDWVHVIITKYIQSQRFFHNMMGFFQEKGWELESEQGNYNMCQFILTKEKEGLKRKHGNSFC